MAGGVGINLVSNGCRQIVGRLQQTRAERDGLGVGGNRVTDVQIQMDLLRDAIWPIRRNMVGRKLHTDHPSTVCVDHAVPRSVPEDTAAQHLSVHCAFDVEVRRQTRRERRKAGQLSVAAVAMVSSVPR